jgi:hypothetical protein
MPQSAVTLEGRQASGRENQRLAACSVLVNVARVGSRATQGMGSKILTRHADQGLAYAVGRERALVPERTEWGEN